MSRKKVFLFGATIVAAGVAAFWPKAAKPTPAPLITHAPTAPKPPVAPLELTLSAAIEQKHAQADFKGNGRDKLTMNVCNTGAQPLRLHLAAGQGFAAEKSTVALLRSHDLSLAPNESKNEDLETVATASTNLPNEASYTISTAAATAKLEPLFVYLNEHPEVSASAAQTAVLAFAENLPLSAFAKFTQLKKDVALAPAAQSLKAETSDIISALLALREAGLDERLALAIEPQLKIEAMIDPLAHALALRYYNIGDEWAYWKHELLQGDASTRHYALYGIARFFPDVALQMLPAWAREPRTATVYRMSAVQALAETQKPEALTVLRQLEQDFGADTDLGKAAHTAAGYLDAQFSKPSKVSVAFRTSKTLAQQQLSADLQTGGVAATN